MIVISKQYSFDASHQLYRKEWDHPTNWEKFGKCSREHGHTYSLEVTISGDVDYYTGMILNYHDLDKIVKPFVEKRLDHFNLNEQYDGLTTAENLVNWIAREIDVQIHAFHDGITLEQVVLRETPKTRAVWRR